MQALMFIANIPRCSAIRNGKCPDLMQRLFSESHLSSRVELALSTGVVEVEHTFTRIKGLILSIGLFVIVREMQRRK